MVILGIDPGTATTGFGLVTEDAAGEAQLLRYGVFLTQAGTPMPQRLLTIFRELSALLAETAPDS